MRGKTVAVDATTLEANAAMKSITCRDTGEDYKKYLKRLLAEESVENATDERAEQQIRGDSEPDEHKKE